MNDLVKQSEYCATCPKMCHFSCPVADASGRESYSPGWLMNFWRLVREGKRDISQIGKNFYACSGCFHCQKYCRWENAVPRAMAQARKKAWSAKVVPSGLLKVAQRIAESGFSYPLPKEGILPESRPGEKVLFPSCSSLVEAFEQVECAFEVSRALLEGVQMVPEVLCCGAPLRASGDEDNWKAHGARLQHELAGAERVIATSPECALALREALPRRIEVTTLFQSLFGHSRNFASENLALRGPLLFYRHPMEVRFLDHEECWKNFATSLAGLEELPFLWTGKDTRGVGMGYGLEYSYPQVARTMARYVLNLAAGQGARGVVTSCSRTRIHLEKEDILKIYSVEEILSQIL